MNYTKPIIKEAVLKLLRRGCGNRDISRRTGVHRATVKRLRSEYDQVFRCKCGQEGTHRGFCSHRFRRSLKRMNVMQHFTLHSPRHYIGLQIPLSRWMTYRDPFKALRSIQKFLGMNLGVTVEDWENIFQSKREVIIDAKVNALVADTEARERSHLIRPSVSQFFRKLAVPSALEYAKNTPKN
jgi:hypothetical protein